MQTTIVTQRLSLPFIRQKCPNMFGLLQKLEVEVILDNTWDGSILNLQTMQLPTPACVYAPEKFQSPPEEIARYCAENGHILFVDDAWIDGGGVNKGTQALLVSLRRYFLSTRANATTTTAEHILIFARVPGELDMRAVRVPQQHWKQFADDAERRKVSIETALQQLFSGISAPSRATVVAPLRVGTIIENVGIYCGGPCKKIHPMNLPHGTPAHNELLRQGWRHVPEAGYICPQCVANAKATRAKRETNNP